MKIYFVHLLETLRIVRILRSMGHRGPQELPVKNVMPVVFALIPLAAVLGACVSSY